MPKYIILLFLIFSFSAFAQQKADEELLIFINKNTDSEFTQSNISLLERDMKSYKIATRLIDVSQSGAPAEVAYTPYILYRNHLGNKLFKGRYTSHKRILNFIRTTRRLPQAAIDYEENNVMVWKQDRANLLFKLKITEASGTNSATFDQKKFNKELMKGLRKGFTGTKYSKTQKVGNTDDIFYCNFYPYISQDGRVFVSTEIYSHYDCIHPVYKQFKLPFSSLSVAEAFDTAATNTFAEIRRQIKDSEIGDAINYATKEIKLIEWKDLNLKKMQAPAESMHSSFKDVDFPQEWTMYGPVDESTPVLAFNFPPPLRQYGGELKEVRATVSLKEKNSLKDASGKFVVEVSSLDMGEGGLNSAVKNSMLHIDRFPTADLEFLNLNSKDMNLKLGKITQVDIEVRLTIVHKSDTLIARSQFEPFLDDKGNLFLHVFTQFTAEDITGSFHISGPDGPSDSNNKMEFTANFLLKPESKSNN
jgi:hypothetical protein